MADGGAPVARYQAGSPSDYHEAPPASRPADAEIQSVGSRLRDWARHLAHNSAIVKATLDARVSKGIGEGLQYEPMIRDRRGNLLAGLNDDVRRSHERWSKRVDPTEELSRQELERVAWREWDTVGELFGRKVYRGRTADRIGYQVQPIKSELVPYGWFDGSKPTLGIDRDEWGKALRVWVYPYQAQAAASLFGLPRLTPVALPAEQVQQLRRQTEIDQTRGVTLFHAVILRTSDIAEYQQSHRRAARASANLFASIHRDPEDGLAGDDPAAPEQRDPNTGQAEINLNDLTILDRLRPGEKLEFHDPEHPNTNAVEFVNQELRQYAAACRVAFSWIAYVFDRAYAAQRVENVHAWEFIYEDRGQFIRDWAHPLLYAEPLRIAILEGRIPPRALRQADPRTLYDVRIQGPVMPSIDPLTDRKAAAIDQDMGWESRHGIIRKFGRSPTQIDAERAADTATPAPISRDEQTPSDEDEDKEEE